MVSDQEIAKGVQTVLRQSDPNAFTSLNGVVQQLEQKLGLDLSHKSGFIRDQINLLLRSPPTTIIPQPPPQQQHDRFALQHFPQFPLSPHFPQQQQQFHHPHFPAFLQQQQQQQPLPPPPPPPRPTPQPLQQQQRPVQRPLWRPPSVGTAGNASKAAKESNSSGSKRRGGSGGLNKVCGVSPELQAVVGEAALPRTEIVKQLWVYIRKHNLQDPGNKRRIICDEVLRSVFETDCTDMFKMNKLLAKHITSLDPTKQSGEVKRLKVETNPATETVYDKAEVSQPPVIVSDALAKFFGTGEREMLQSDALRRLWDYIKVNHLEDPLNPMVIVCDAKLQELLGCESISALGIPEVLARHHLFRQQ